MAIACLRLFTFRPDPLSRVPFFRRRMADSTFLDADLPYFAIRVSSPFGHRQAQRSAPARLRPPSTPQEFDLFQAPWTGAMVLVEPRLLTCNRWPMAVREDIELDGPLSSNELLKNHAGPLPRCTRLYATDASKRRRRRR
jgi:hypothetical protein